MSLPADLAQRQLDAYNAHDIDAFVACYTPDVEAFLLPGNERLFQGRDALRERYGPYFKAKKPHATLTDRAVLGRFAVDFEEVVLADGTQMAAWALYHVEEGLIRTIWFVKG
jgi:hypothetical protein